MQRVIARHSFGPHHVDVAEIVDDDGERLQILIDGDLLGPDQTLQHPMSRIEAAQLLDRWLEGSPPPTESVREHVAAVFDDRDQAGAALSGLRALGVDDDHIGVALNEGESIVFEHDDEHSLLRRVIEGLAVGGPVGALAGIGLAAVVIPGLAIGGLAAFGGAGALWGLLAGGYAGTSIEAGSWGQHEEFRSLRLDPGQVLVVVMGHGHAHEVSTALETAGGRIVGLISGTAAN